jgi:segregation and condensation protein B
LSRKRKQQPAVALAVPEEILAEGSGPSGAVVQVGVDAIDSGLSPISGEPEVAALADDLEQRMENADVAPVVGEDIDVADVAEGATEADGEAVDAVAAMPTSASSMDAAQLKQLVEALVFASDKPITVLRLRQLTRVSDTKRLEQALAELAVDYCERGLVLQTVSGGYQFRTRTQWAPWVQQLIAGRPVRLTRAQLETLSIIAYRQPITRPEIDEIRGVDSSATLKLLIERGLIRILGKREEVGRPMLYGTTKEFLDFFSLGDLRELPTLREYSELTDESRQVMSDRLGIDPDDEGGEGESGPSNGSNGSNGSAPSGEHDGAAGMSATEVVELDDVFAVAGVKLADASSDAPADASDGDAHADAMAAHVAAEHVAAETSGEHVAAEHVAAEGSGEHVAARYADAFAETTPGEVTAAEIIAAERGADHAAEPTQD